MADQLIVVPLDGSELSERAIPYALLFAKTFGGRVLLATVWEGAEEALTHVLPAVSEDIFKEGERFYEKYLAKTAEKYAIEGVKIDAEVFAGNAAETLLKLVEDRHADVLALATHGRSGVGRWWFGSVSGEVIHRATVPRLVVGPKVLSQPARAIKVDGVLVPLDGSKLAESALEHGVRIAKQFGAALHLAQVISPTSQTFLFDMPSVATLDIQGQIEQGVNEYLHKTGQRLAAQAQVKTCVLRGPPADALADYVEAQGIDLVVMASHGRGGLARVALGSIADRMLQSDAPVYLVKPVED
jgi:nucleotide-binding universal stress UspA family protein